MKKLVIVAAMVLGFALAASVSLRRKGFSKLGLVIQFAGIALFTIILGIDNLLYVL